MSNKKTKAHQLLVISAWWLKPDIKKPEPETSAKCESTYIREQRVSTIFQTCVKVHKPGPPGDLLLIHLFNSTMEKVLTPG